MYCSQQVPEKSKDGPGTPWQFVGLLPLFDPPRHDSAETIRRALNLGVNVKMITGDHLFIFHLKLKVISSCFLSFFLGFSLIKIKLSNIQVTNLPLERRPDVGLEWELTCIHQLLYWVSTRMSPLPAFL